MLVEVRAPVPARPVATVAHRPRWRRAVGKAQPYLYLAPALGVLGVWVYRPLVETVRYSFYDWDLVPTTPKVAVGWANYQHVLHLPQLWAALRVSGIFAAGMILWTVLVPLAVGVGAQAVGPRARAAYRAIVFAPVLVSPVVAVTVWSFLLTPNGGLVNRLLGPFGIHDLNWLVHPAPARLAVLLVAGWKSVGIAVVLVSAGLTAIDGRYYEAAAIDGATRRQMLRQLTLPLLSPTLLFLAVMAVLLSSQSIFPVVNSLTQGGPTGATTDIYYLLYTYGFSSFDVGAASATAVLFFAAFGALAIVCLKLLDRFSFHDA